MRVAFDSFEIDSEGGVLLRGERPVALERRVFQMLCYFVAHPGRLIDKRELLQEVWHVPALSDAVLSNTIAKLRKALGQAPGARSPIETVYGRGYRLIAKVRPLSAAGILPDSRAFTADVFVGRHDVLAFLVDRLEKALAGAAQLVVIEGEAGIGKTRTLTELSLRARSLGVSSWFVRVHDEGAPAYWPWRQLLRTVHADLGPGSWRWHLPRDVWALRRFAPELFVRGAPLSTPDTEVLRFRLFDELARLLRSASREGPRLIVLDDLHASDSASIELLSYLVRMLQDSPIVFAASVRTHETLDEFTAEALRRLRRDAASVALDGLSVPDVSQLVAALSRVHVRSARLDSLLHQRSGGNPFFVRQIVELLAQRGLPLDLRQLAALKLPPGICEVIERRLAALPTAAQRVLRAAAVLGREFDAALLATILGDDLECVVTALEPARRSEMIEPCAVVPQRFAFTHALLCELLYDGLTLSERGAFHASAARALAGRPSRVEPQHLAELARHALRALPCEIESCLAHCARAADAARAAAGYETAAELGSRAAEKLASEGGDERQRCELLISAGYDHFCAGHVETAWRTLRSGAQLARHRGDPRQLAQCAFRLADCVESGVGDESEVRADLEYAIELAGDADPGLCAALLAHRAELGFDLEADERRVLFERAQSLAERSGEVAALLEVASSRAVQRHPGALEDNRAAIEAWSALVHAHPDAAIGLCYGGFRRFAIGVSSYLCDLTSGNLRAADASFARCRVVAERSHLPALRLVVQLMAAGRELAGGQLEALQQSIRTLSQAPAESGVLGLAWQSFYVDWLDASGKFDVLRAIVLEDPANSPVLGPRQRLNAAVRHARLHASFGRRMEARVLLLRIPERELMRLPVMYGDLGLLCELGETYTMLEDLGGARRVYAQLEPHAARNAVGPAFQYLGSVSHYLGVLAALLGQHERSLAHFDDALTLNQRLGMPLQLARTRMRRADVLRVRPV